MKIIVETPVNGIAPSAAAKNLASTVRLICTNAEIIELPNADYMRKVRSIMQNVLKVATAYELGNNPKWLQAF